MALAVDTPDPPELEPNVDAEQYDDVEVVGDADYRREELQAFLEEGAWERAFAEWSEDTDMDEADFAAAVDLGLFGDFDFFVRLDGYSTTAKNQASRRAVRTPFPN